MDKDHAQQFNPQELVAAFTKVGEALGEFSLKVRAGSALNHALSGDQDGLKTAVISFTPQEPLALLSATQTLAGALLEQERTSTCASSDGPPTKAGAATTGSPSRSGPSANEATRCTTTP